MKKALAILTTLFLASPLFAARISDSELELGRESSTDNKVIEFKIGEGANNPKIRANFSNKQLEFSQDGINFSAFGTGDGGSGINLISNPGYEQDLADWTNTGSATFSVDTDAADVYLGSKSALWDAAAASDTLSSEAVTIPGGLRGNLCSIEVQYKGGDEDIALQAHDGTDVLAAVDLVASPDRFTKSRILFTCPDSGTIQGRLFASGNAAAINVDQWVVGRSADIIGISSTPDWYVYAQYGGPSSLGTSDDITYGPLQDAALNFTGDIITKGVNAYTACTAGTPSGDTCASGSELYGIAVDVPQAGNVRVCMTSMHRVGGTTDTENFFRWARYQNGSLTPIETQQVSRVQSRQDITDAGDQIHSVVQLCHIFEVEAGLNSFVMEEFTTVNSGTPTSNALESTRFEVYPVSGPQSSDVAATIETSAYHFNAEFTSGSWGIGTSTQAEYNLQNEPLATVETKGESLEVRILCDGGTAATPNCNGQSVDELLGIEVTIPRAGNHYVCTSFQHSADENSGTSDVSQAFRLDRIDANAPIANGFAGTSYTVLESGDAHTQRVDLSASSISDQSAYIRICSVFKLPVGKNAFTISERTSVNSGILSGHSVLAVNWQIIPIDQQLPQAILLKNQSIYQLSSSGSQNLSQSTVTDLTGSSLTLPAGAYEVEMHFLVRSFDNSDFNFVTTNFQLVDSGDNQLVNTGNSGLPKEEDGPTYTYATNFQRSGYFELATTDTVNLTGQIQNDPNSGTRQVQRWELIITPVEKRN